MAINSIADLVVNFSLRHPTLTRFRKMYEIQRQTAVRLKMNKQGWTVAKGVMRPKRKRDIEEQTLFILRDKFLGNEVIYNPLRSKRGGPPAGPDPRDQIDRKSAAKHCPWCEPKSYWQPDLWADEFGQEWETDGRYVAQANWARLAPISGIALGNHLAHELLELSLDNFLAMFDMAERYIRRARKSRPAAKSFIIFLNGGPKAAASVAHAHVQIVGKEGSRHFGYAETILARCGPEYWMRVRRVHEDLGLSFTKGHCVGWVSVAPLRDCDITVVSPTISEGAHLVYQLLQNLIRKGTTNYTLAAILSPKYVTHQASRFDSPWPPVLWRLMDRGATRAKHCDVGSMEFFGSYVVATDPFDLAGWVGNGISA